MPTVVVNREHLFEAIGKKFSKDLIIYIHILS